MSTDSNDKPGGEFVLYQTEDGQNRIQCQLVDGTIWLSQMQMGELFQRSKKTISEHLQNIFEEGELAEASVVRKFRTTEFSFNSPSLNILLMCSEIVRLSFPKKVVPFATG